MLLYVCYIADAWEKYVYIKNVKTNIYKSRKMGVNVFKQLLTTFTRNSYLALKAQYGKTNSWLANKDSKMASLFVTGKFFNNVTIDCITISNAVVNGDINVLHFLNGRLDMSDMDITVPFPCGIVFKKGRDANHPITNCINYDFENDDQDMSAFNAFTATANKYLKVTFPEQGAWEYIHKSIAGCIKGYATKSESELKKFLYLYGKGNNGKSMLLELLKPTHRFIYCDDADKVVFSKATGTLKTMCDGTIITNVKDHPEQTKSVCINAMLLIAANDPLLLIGNNKSITRRCNSYHCQTDFVKTAIDKLPNQVVEVPIRDVFHSLSPNKYKSYML